MTFTQFIMPNGRTKKITIERPEAIEIKADVLLEAGYRLEIEILRNDMISMTIGSPHGDREDIAIRLCENGPKIPLAVDELIHEAWHLANAEGDFD